jgi:hypothetical protein
MMKLAMASLHADLNPTVVLEYGNPFHAFRANSLPSAAGRGQTLRVTGLPKAGPAVRRVRHRRFVAL